MIELAVIKTSENPFVFTASPAAISLGAKGANLIDSLHITVPEEWQGKIIKVTFNQNVFRGGGKITATLGESMTVPLSADITACSGDLVIDAQGTDDTQAYSAGCRYTVYDHPDAGGIEQSIVPNDYSQFTEEIKGYRDSAQSSATAAQSSETNAKASESASANNSISAADSATSANASKEAAALSEANSKESETAADASKSACALSEQNAKTSETAAQNSETAAFNSAAVAQSSEASVSASASAAAQSEANAKSSEISAGSSKTAAQNSATEADASKSAAAQSETNAHNSATAAEASSQTAQSAQTSASASATSASNSASDASTSAAAALQSETNAKASETTVSNSATAAANSAAASLLSETNSKASETAAKTSETNSAANATAASESAIAAAGSATAADSSKTAAAQSETNAASSATSASSSATSAQESANKAVEYATIFQNSVYHNSIFRGKDISSNEADGSMYTNIANGTFDDIFVGDYFTKTINGTSYVLRVAGIDSYLNRGDTALTTHHIVVVPDTVFGNYPIHDTGTIDGGYVGSKMYTDTLPLWAGYLSTSFGTHLLTLRELLVNAISSTIPSGWAWYDSKVGLMTSEEVAGCGAFGTNTSGYSFNIGINYNQLPLFQISPDKICIRHVCWLRNIVNYSTLCTVNDSGELNRSNILNSNGIRPKFLLG